MVNIYNNIYADSRAQVLFTEHVEAGLENSFEEELQLGMCLFNLYLRQKELMRLVLLWLGGAVEGIHVRMWDAQSVLLWGFANSKQQTLDFVVDNLAQYPNHLQLNFQPKNQSKFHQNEQNTCFT